MIDPTEAVAVDSGLILMVDPCYLFTDAQWKRICHKAHGGKVEVPIEDVILDTLKLRRKDTGRTSAVVKSTRHGDGRFEVERRDDGLVIRGA